ncbi:hypothetical protein DdX_17593 [Ditylenchus destructor]|uniref:Uncharacterized protein n=1 Tax=Ditylenchus destructor TaxID=166010 RepID=A0AAD4QTB9_9BILA|nr:hypothetical protein DdX_17593 [Ditylenchus destructor]
MTENTCNQNVTVFIFLIIFVSSFSPVVRSSPKKDPPQRILKGNVYVRIPENSPPPDSIVVFLKGHHEPRSITRLVRSYASREGSIISGSAEFLYLNF